MGCGLSTFNKVLSDFDFFDCCLHFAQDLLSAPASEAYVERVFSVCAQLTADNKKSANYKPREQITLKINLKYYE